MLLPSNWTGGLENVTGYFIDVMKSLQYLLNFKVDLIPSTDGTWGAEKADGSWTGMVGMVISGEADICGAALSLSSARAKARLHYSKYIHFRCIFTL